MDKKSIAEFRSFNRFYTSVIGLLDKHILHSNYTLAEVRIMYEIYHGKNQTASNLIQSLSIDKGYLSRVLRQFEKRKFIVRQRSSADTRINFLHLTPEGKKEFELLDRASDDQVKSIAKKLSKKDLAILLESMAQVKRILRHK
jgi:DNA-binding MarR family transcriptional regulator